MKKNLTVYVLCLLALLVTLSIGLTGAAWLMDTVQEYRSDVRVMTKTYMDRQREILRQQVHTTLREIQFLRSTVLRRAESLVRERTDAGWQTARGIIAQQDRLQPGALPDLIRETLRAIRPPDHGYYFAINLDGTEELFTDRPEMEGRDMRNVRDSEGRYVVRDMLRLARTDRSVLYRYTWTKPGHGEKTFAKVAAIRRLHGLDWVIGTGIYLDDMEESVKKEALEWIENYRWGPDNRGYIFAGTWEGISLSGPFKGKNMLGITDPNGVHIMQELIRQARKGGGFVEYVMPRTKNTRPAPKLSYAAPVSDWGWYVGTGRYVDEIDSLIAQRRRELRRQLIHHLLLILLFLAGFALAALFLVRLMGHRLRGNIRPFTAFFHQAATEAVRIEEEKLDFEEFRLLARDANRMVQERYRIEQKLGSREQVLSQLTRAALQLLTGPDLNLAIRDALRIVARGFGVERAYLFEAREEDASGGRLDLKHEWCAQEVTSRLADPRFQDMRYNVFQARWFKELQQGKAIQGFPGDFSSRAAAMMREYRVQALLIVPVLYRNRFWGMLCLDNCRHAVRWDDYAIQSLQNFAATLCLVIMQRRSEQEAIRNRDQWIDTFNAIEDGIFILDRQGILINANRAALALAGVEELEEIRGQNLPALLHGRGSRYRKCLVELVLEEGRHLVDEIHAPNLERDFQASVFPLTEKDGRPRGVIFIARDITEQKKMEQQLIQARKMEALGVLAGGIAHDFNNILAAIIGFAELAKIALGDQRHAQAEDDLGQILTAAGRAKDLVAQMLAFSRNQSGTKSPILVTPILKETVKMLRAFIPAAITIRTELGRESRKIMADATALHQVLMNLASNGAHAMRESGGELLFSLEETDLLPESAVPGRQRSNTTSSWLHLAVSDQGGGIDPGIMDRIFDPFFTTKKTGEGTGMGLAAVHGIMHDHGGSILIDNRPGQGVTFHLYLPQLAEEEDETARSAPDRPSLPVLPGSVILVVDDEAPLRKMYEDMLPLLGGTPLLAESPEQALALLEKKKEIDLLFTDLSMPGMNGLQLARAARRLRPDLPILLCSGLTATLEESEIEAAGISRIINKPVTLESLGQALADLIHSRP